MSKPRPLSLKYSGVKKLQSTQTEVSRIRDLRNESLSERTCFFVETVSVLSEESLLSEAEVFFVESASKSEFDAGR